MAKKSKKSTKGSEAKAAATGNKTSAKNPSAGSVGSSPKGPQGRPNRGGRPTRALRKHFEREPLIAPPFPRREPYTERTPRVREVRHLPWRAKGQYATLVEDPSDYREFGLGPLPIPVPDIAIYRGWLYVTGNAPCVGTTAVVAQAEGCKLLLYYYSQSGYKYSRTCYLEGTPETLVWIYPDPEDRGNVGWLSSGTYADAEVDVNTNKFLRWKGAVDDDPIVEELATLDESQNPPSPTYAYVTQRVAEGQSTEPID